MSFDCAVNVMVNCACQPHVSCYMSGEGLLHILSAPADVLIKEQSGEIRTVCRSVPLYVSANVCNRSHTVTCIYLMRKHKSAADMCVVDGSQARSRDARRFHELQWCTMRSQRWVLEEAARTHLWPHNRSTCFWRSSGAVGS